MAIAKAVRPPSNVTLTLELSAEEAKKLKSMMQNEWFSGEGDVVRELREDIWRALSDAGVDSV